MGLQKFYIQVHYLFEILVRPLITWYTHIDRKGRATLSVLSYLIFDILFSHLCVANSKPGKMASGMTFTIGKYFAYFL